jgi:hypothetical protein
VPVLRSQVDDPFMMNKDEVNTYIVDFFKKNGFEAIELARSNKFVDVKARKFDWHIWVESRGSRSSKHREGIVFESSDLWINLCEQVGQFMCYRQTLDTPILMFMGNPDIPRIRRYVAKIEKSLDRLEIIRLWVQQDGQVFVEGPQEMTAILQKIGI